MIKSFKIFERYSSNNELTDQFDDDYVDKWYEKNNSIDESEVISMASTDKILDYFDDDQYKEDFINGYISGYEFSELESSDLKSYIEEHLDDKKEQKILDIINSNNYDEDDDIVSEIEGKVSFIKTKKDNNRIVITSNKGEIKKYKIPGNYTILVQENQYITADTKLASGEETEFNDSMLDDLSKDELQDVIEDSNEEYDCIEETINGWYDGRSGQDILEEFHNIDNLEASELYDIIEDYVDASKMAEDWTSEEDSDTKRERIGEEIYRDVELQRYLIEKDPDNAVEIEELWSERGSEDIGDEYDFQKGYIEKKKKDDYDPETDDEEYLSDIMGDILLYLDNSYGLNDDIEEEYSKYMEKVELHRAVKTYNL